MTKNKFFRLSRKETIFLIVFVSLFGLAGFTYWYITLNKSSASYLSGRIVRDLPIITKNPPVKANPAPIIGSNDSSNTTEDQPLDDSTYNNNYENSFTLPPVTGGSFSALNNRRVEVSINVPQQNPNQCNKAAWNAISTYVTQRNPSSYISFSSWGINLTYSHVFPKGASWQSFNNIHVMTLADFQNIMMHSLRANGPVVLGTGLKIPHPGSPGHFYIVRGYYFDNSGQVRFLLRDGHGKTNHDFTFKGMNNNPTAQDLYNLPPNTNINENGRTTSASVMLAYNDPNVP